MLRLALLSTLLLAAPEELTLREGGGWAGFKAGSRIKTRTSFVGSDGKPSISVATQTLRKVETERLTLETTTVDILGEEKSSTQTIPARGEAGDGEKSGAVEALPGETIETAKTKFACDRSRVAVEGASGKRVVTTSVARDPRVVVKRVVETFDAKGVRLSTETWLLTDLLVPREIGARTLRCLAYKTLASDATGSNEGEALVCRDVPGGTVRMARTIFRDGKQIGRVLLELVEFDAK